MRPGKGFGLTERLSHWLPHLTKLEVCVTVFGTVLGLLLTWSQLRIARSGEERAQREEPLAYTLEAAQSRYEYEIQREGESIRIPAPSLRLKVTHGSLDTVTAITFDGTRVYELAVLPVRESWQGCVVDIAVPPEALIVDGETVYDYFFLFLEPTQGENQLDLICSTVDLEEQTVRCSTFHRVALVQLSYGADGPQGQMLQVYDDLRRELERLGLLAAEG